LCAGPGSAPHRPGPFFVFSLPASRPAPEIRIGSKPLPIPCPLQLSALCRRQPSPPPIPAVWRTSPYPQGKPIHYRSIICQDLFVENSRAQSSFLLARCFLGPRPRWPSDPSPFSVACARRVAEMGEGLRFGSGHAELQAVVGLREDIGSPLPAVAAHLLATRPHGHVCPPSPGRGAATGLPPALKPAGR